MRIEVTTTTKDITIESEIDTKSKCEKKYERKIILFEHEH